MPESRDHERSPEHAAVHRFQNSFHFASAHHRIDFRNLRQNLIAPGGGRSDHPMRGPDQAEPERDGPT